MKNTIGFNVKNMDNAVQTSNIIYPEKKHIPRKSVVRVYFPKRNMTLSYYNDMFDLHCGDLVYVDGKLEGLQGEIVDVNYTFKIKLSDYKRVIALIDTSVKGQLYVTGSHFLTFDASVLPYDRVRTWFKPAKSEDEYEIGKGDESFPLNDLGKMKITGEIAERGNKYYLENRVCYICVDGGSGKAIVEGNDYYDVEFTYTDGAISDLVCSCFCSYTCKHQFAAMLQLRECIDNITTEYAGEYSDYFAAISKGVFINKVLKNKTKGKFVVDI